MSQPEDFPTEEPNATEGDLGDRVVRGAGWMMTSQAAIQVLGLITSVVVARFLGPREVGLAAEALVFTTLALVVVDFGFAAILVQRPQLTEEDRSTAFWASMVLGAGLTVVGFALSWPIADLFGEPRVQPLFAVLSLTFLFTAPGIVQGGLLTRELQFRSLELRTVVATTASCATAISLAIAGFGPWAIVAQSLVISAVSTALLWRASSWRPRARFSFASLRSMARFTTHVFGTRTLEWATITADNLLVGRFLGASALGAYTIAYSLIVSPVKRIALPLAQVFFPAFSKMRDPARIAAAWLRASRLIALIVVPVMLGMIVVAPDLIDGVFGERWESAVPVIQLLAPVGLLQSLSALNVSILQSLDRTRLLLRFSLVLSLASVGAFAAGLPWGITGVATAYLIVTLLLQPVFMRITAAALGVGLGAWVRSVGRVLEAAVPMGLIVLGARAVLLETEVSDVVRLAILIAVGVLVYVPLALWRVPASRDEMRELRRRLRHAPTPAPGVPL